MLNKKIVELLKIYWKQIDSRYNKELQSYAITPILEPAKIQFNLPLPKPLWMMIFIEGNKNNFKVKFDFQEKIQPDKIEDAHQSHVWLQIRKSTLKIEILRKIEELCYSLENTYDLNKHDR